MAEKPSVEQVVSSIRKFHALGSKSLAIRPQNALPHSEVVDDEAKKLGVTPAQLRKARSFANAKTGYDSSALDALCQDIRTHFDKFTSPKSMFGIAHVLRLVTIPTVGGERNDMQRLVFEQGWTTAKLNTEVRRLYGRRKKGGRPKLVGDKNELMERLEFFCEGWRRWHKQITTVSDSTDKAPIDDLSANIRKLLPPVEEAIAKLHKAVAAVVLPKPSK